MGVVYAARSTAGASVAIKFLALGADDETLARFEREAEAHARVDAHPNVARVHSAGVYGNQPYLVMDLLPGGDLQTRLRGGPLPAEEVRALGAALARGLAHVHAQGVLHRDIKPANVLFDERGDPRLTDFGLARPVEASSLTASGALLGTPGYLSPEQARSEEASVASDVFGLGATLYAALAGRAPFAGTSLLASLDLLLRAPPPPLPPEVPADLRAAILKALEKDPAERFPDALTFARALEAGGESPRGQARGLLALALFMLVVLGLGLLVLGSTGFGALAGLGLARSQPPQPASPSPASPQPEPSARASASPPKRSKLRASRKGAGGWSRRGVQYIEPGLGAEGANAFAIVCWLDERRFVTLAGGGIYRVWKPGPDGRAETKDSFVFGGVPAQGDFALGHLEDGWFGWGSTESPLQFLRVSESGSAQGLRTVVGVPSLWCQEVLPGGRLLLLTERRICLWRFGSKRLEWARSLLPPEGADLTPSATLLLGEQAGGLLEVLVSWVPVVAAESTGSPPRLERLVVGPKTLERTPLPTPKGRLRGFVLLGGRIFCGDEVGRLCVAETATSEFLPSQLLRDPQAAMPGAHHGAIRGLALGRGETLVSLGADVPDLRVWRLPNSLVETVDLSARRNLEQAFALHLSPDRSFALVQFKTHLAVVPLP